MEKIIHQNSSSSSVEENFRYQPKRKRKAVISSSDDDDDHNIDNHEISSLGLGDDDDIDDSSSSSVKQNPCHQLKGRRQAVVSSSDDEISSQNLKKIGAGARFVYSYADNQTHAQPLIRCVWTGTFNVFYDESIYHRRVYNFNAFLSSKASEKQRDLAGEMEAELVVEMVPKPYVWPKSFRGRGPSDADIAVYFFPPSKEHERDYDWLVAEMMECDLGIRMIDQDNKKSDLRIFTSHDLPFKFRRFQGKLFLWGTFL